MLKFQLFSCLSYCFFLFYEYINVKTNKKKVFFIFYKNF